MWKGLLSDQFPLLCKSGDLRRDKKKSAGVTMRKSVTFDSSVGCFGLTLDLNEKGSYEVVSLGNRPDGVRAMRRDLG